MAVKIRLAKRGRKKLALYDIVVADSRSPRDGKFIEKLGTYNPNVHPVSVVLDDTKTFDWLMKGAAPTDTTRTLLSERGLMFKKHLQVGVNKGAITQEAADKKLADWVNAKGSASEKLAAELENKKAAAKKAKYEAEMKVNEARAEKIKNKNVVVETPVAEATEEAPAAEASATEEGEAKSE